MIQYTKKMCVRQNKQLHRSRNSILYSVTIFDFGRVTSSDQINFTHFSVSGGWMDWIWEISLMRYLSD